MTVHPQARLRVRLPDLRNTVQQENDITPVEILELRKRCNLTQEQFAEHLGASVDTLKSWETGRRHPSGTARKALRDLSEKMP